MTLGLEDEWEYLLSTAFRFFLFYFFAVWDRHKKLRALGRFRWDDSEKRDILFSLRRGETHHPPLTHPQTHAAPSYYIPLNTKTKKREGKKCDEDIIHSHGAGSSHSIHYWKRKKGSVRGLSLLLWPTWKEYFHQGFSSQPLRKVGLVTIWQNQCLFCYRQCPWKRNKRDITKTTTDFLLRHPSGRKDNLQPLRLLPAGPEGLRMDEFVGRKTSRNEKEKKRVGSGDVNGS